MKKRFLSAFFLLGTISSFASCEPSKTYTITWKNDDGSVLSVTNVKRGRMPVYDKETPMKEPTDSTVYTFSGWSPKLVKTTEDATYTATYTSSVRKYTIWWYNDEEETKLLHTEDVEYNTMPTYHWQDKPSKPETDRIRYDWNGWKEGIVRATSNAVYHAHFDEVNKYLVTFKNDDGSVLQESYVAEDSLPVYEGKEPTKPSDVQYSYKFKGWDKQFVKPTDDKSVYTATYTPTLRKYTIFWYNDEEETEFLHSEELEYGATPSYHWTDVLPSKEETDRKRYDWNGWEETIVTVAGEAHYHAHFDEVNKWLVTFMDEDKTTVLQEGYYVPEDELPEYEGATPTKKSTDQYVYVFDGWDNKIAKPTEDTIYYATYTDKDISITLTFEALESRKSLSFTNSEKLMVDWGDGTADEATSHTYKEFNKIYTVKIGGLVDTFSVFSPGIKSVVVSNKVTSLGDYAFCLCESLTSVTLSNSVTSIGQHAFSNCTALTSINLPSSLEKNGIGSGAFSNCSSLESITIPDNVNYIDDDTFSNCSSLESITFPDIVYSIGDRVFYGCSSLGSITIPSSVLSIGNSAFVGCSSLTSIEVDNENYVYDSRNDCNAIIDKSNNSLIVGCKNTVIPNSVTSIGKSAFQGCTDLDSITIPNSVTSIGEFSFYGCFSLDSITIPNSVISIGDYAFGACTSLASIEVENGNLKYDSRDNCNAIIDSTNNELVIGCKGTIIPSSVTSIGDYAFIYATSLDSMTIPSSVTSIGESSFYGCSSLDSIVIPNSVDSIGRSAFHSCSSLSLLDLTNCDHVVTAGELFLEETSDELEIRVKASLVDEYKSADNWSEYEGRFIGV